MLLTVKVRPQEGDSTNVCTLDPVAQALREAVGLPRAGHPHVKNNIWPGTTRSHAFAQPSRLFARGPQWQIACDAPASVRDWILHWDETGGGEPFDFEVEAHPTDNDVESFVPGSFPPGDYIYPLFGGFYDRTRSAEWKRRKDAGK